MVDLFGETCPCCGGPIPQQQATSFDDFWNDIPCKIGKAQARKTWNRMSKQDRILAKQSVSAWYSRWRKQHPDAAWIHPSTFLSQKRWEDEGEIKGAPSTGDALAFYAEWINGERYIPATAISDTMKGDLIRAGLVTKERLEQRGFL